MTCLLVFAALAAPVPPAWSELRGPWTGGAWVDLATSPDGSVQAVWIDAGGTLRWAAGPDWAAPETVAPAAEAGDGGQIRPQLAVDGAGRAVVLYVAGDRARLARRGPQGWSHADVAPAAGNSALADLAVVDGEPVVAWLAATGGASVAWVGGVEVYRSGEDGTCPCCKPDLLARADGLTLAVRDADGPRRDVRLLVRRGGAWTDQGDATTGRWSPGGCPADGPALTMDALYVSDARDGRRRIWRVDAAGEAALPLRDAGAEAVQVRATPDGQAVFWTEVKPGSAELVMLEGGAPMRVTGVAGSLTPGEPVVVGRELWIPTDGDAARVWVQSAP